jgi:hypothetical protein
MAKDLFKKGINATLAFTSPRAWAFSILGLEKIMNASFCEECLPVVEELAARLNNTYILSSSASWKWFENKLAYDNARIPQALINAGYLLSNQEYIANGIAALKWLIEVQTDVNGHFLPIGSNGFYVKGGERAMHDQQPLEATATIESCLDTYLLTNQAFWKDEVQRAHDWFSGANSERRSLIDIDTGGCKDGLTKSGLNHNQGAESTLAYVAASLAYRQMKQISLSRRVRYLG